MEAAEDAVLDNGFCKICYLAALPQDELISPCDCRGTIRFVHRSCLKRWRYRGKRIRDIRRCEQCFSLYRLENEVVLHRLLISLLSAGVLVAGYLLSTVVFKSLVDAFVIVVRDFFFADMHVLVDFDVGRNLEYVFFQRKLASDYRLASGMHAYLFILVLSYQVFSKLSFFSMFNYMFTFWRLNQFGFVIDKALFGVMSAYYMKRAYDDVYNRIDTGLVFLLNYKAP